MTGFVTIKDVAREAGVSIATVSYVLNKSRTVSPENVGRVERAARLLGYSPNGMARNLRHKRTKTLGLIVPDSANPFFAELAKGVEDAGFDRGYTVLLCNSNRDSKREQAYLDTLQARRVDGIILAATTPDVDAQIQAVSARGIPMVLFYRDPGPMRVDTFRYDNRLAGWMATRHLIELGHRRIACIGPAFALTPSYQRVEGYRQALRESGLRAPETLLLAGDNLMSGGMEATRKLIQSGQEFTAIFASNDAMAIGALSAMREAGRCVPRDVSVIGFDDIAYATFCDPPLTTIANPKQELGAMAVRYLLERIEEDFTGEPRDVQLELKLVVRQSTAPPKTSE